MILTTVKIVVKHTVGLVLLSSKVEHIQETFDQHLKDSDERTTRLHRRLDSLFTLVTTIATQRGVIVDAKETESSEHRDGD